MKKYLIILSLLAALLIGFAPSALAADCEYPATQVINGQTVPCPIRHLSGFVDFLTTIFNIFFALMIIAASFTFVYAAFLYITSEGMMEEIRKVKRMLIYAMIALVIAVFAWGLPRVIISFL